MSFYTALALIIQISLLLVLWHFFIAKLNWNSSAIIMVSSIAAFSAYKLVF